jgi:diaminohydroxyphosphoribosylaminopyrimidine deaminase/5-amino-6-(5-phosphoribosylamino)uracil reductase
MALRQAGESARGAILYVTLEPCCHFGRTPPCTRALIDAGVVEVHAAMLDPNPKVGGCGAAELEAAGIRLVVGEHGDKARAINEAYIKFITTGLPFVTAKFAMSLDGKIATRTTDSKWISNEESRKIVHNLRHSVDAIMVGLNTVLVDDPHLTARFSSGRGGKTVHQPLRVVVDSRGSIPVSANVFREPGKTLIAVAQSPDAVKLKALNDLGVEVFEVGADHGRVDLVRLLKLLGERQVTHVLVEGGGRLMGSLFDAQLVDKVMVFIAPIIIGGDGARSAIGGQGVEKVADALRLENLRWERFGNDMLATGYVAGKK